MDARVKAAVAQVPVIDGKDVAAHGVDADRRRAGGARAAGAHRRGAGDGGRAGDGERRGGEARARRVSPVRALDAIPQTTSVLFVVAEKETA